LTEKTLGRIARKEKGLKRHLRKLARQKPGSRNRAKTRDRLATKRAYPTCALKDFTHKASYAIARMEELQVVALEALQIKNMVAKPRAKQDPKTGKWLRNGARAKAGLAKSILARGWGRLQEQLAYKLARKNKMLLAVPAHYSSQECSHCGHTHADNRRAQRFVCLKCGLALHADENAARVLAKRGVAFIRAGAPGLEKRKKRAAFQRKERAVPKVQLSWTDVVPEKNIKAGLVEPGVPVEDGVSRKPGSKPRWTRSPKKQERLIAKSDAPTTVPLGA
jgi:putative transposase